MPSWDGSSFTGWTVVNATVDGALGNPLPSFNCNPNQYAHIDAGQIYSSTIEFDFYINGAAVGLCDFFFGCDAAGAGPMLRLDSRGGTNYSGVMVATSWTAWGTPPASGPAPAATTWHHVKLVVNAAGTSVDWYLDTVFQATTSITVNGTNIGLQGDGGTNGGHFDNISVTGGSALTITGLGVTKLIGAVALFTPNTTPPSWPIFTFGDGYVTIAYFQSWDMPAASSPVTYTVNSGSLPPGLSLNAIAGNQADISGTPTTAGTYSFVLRASNSYGTADRSFSITIHAAPGGGSSMFLG